MSDSLISGSPLVSIIIPNYNHSRFLGDAIHSALVQTYPNKEIIIVDDGSTDNCREVVDRFGSRVHYIWQNNQGLAGARNTGIRVSNGELIGLLDADDMWKPSYLEEMIGLAQNYPDAAAYYCQTNCIDVNGNLLPQVMGGPPVDPEEIYWVLIRSNFIIPSTVLLRKSIVIEVGLFDQSLRSCEDWDLWLRLLPDRKIIGSPLCLVRYRIHGSSLSTNVGGMHDAARAVVKKHFGEDDGQYDSWSSEKRRAYGGLYWYQAWTSLSRTKDWEIAKEYLFKAIRTDPTLGENLDFYYELALGDQPMGFRGTSQVLNLQTNVEHLVNIFAELETGTDQIGEKPMYSRFLSKAYFAFGVLAYNVGEFNLSRLYMFRALKYRWRLITNKRFDSLFFKALLGKRLIKYLRNLRESTNRGNEHTDRI